MGEKELGRQPHAQEPGAGISGQQNEAGILHTQEPGMADETGVHNIDGGSPYDRPSMQAFLNAQLMQLLAAEPGLARLYAQNVLKNGSQPQQNESNHLTVTVNLRGTAEDLKAWNESRAVGPRDLKEYSNNASRSPTSQQPAELEDSGPGLIELMRQVTVTALSNIAERQACWKARRVQAKLNGQRRDYEPEDARQDQAPAGWHGIENPDSHSYIQKMCSGRWKPGPEDRLVPRGTTRAAKVVGTILLVGMAYGAVEIYHPFGIGKSGTEPVAAGSTQPGTNEGSKYQPIQCDPRLDKIEWRCGAWVVEASAKSSTVKVRPPNSHDFTRIPIAQAVGFGNTEVVINDIIDGRSITSVTLWIK